MKGEGKKRRVRVCAFHHRDELIDRHPRFFEPRSSPPPPSLRFFFLRISIMVEKIFFAAPRCRSRLRSRFKKTGRRKPPHGYEILPPFN